MTAREMLYEALLDDPEFLAELDKLDVAAPARDARESRYVDYVRPTIDEWADAVFDPAPAPATGRLATVMTMLGGTLAGALLATAVFHEQVIRIIESLGQ